MVFRAIVHGSFRRHFSEIQEVMQILTQAGIEVLAPRASSITTMADGFAYLEGEELLDPRLIELRYISHLRVMGNNGFSYFVNPDGYLGRTASYELAIAQATGTRCFFGEALRDHPVYVPGNSFWQAELLAEYIAEKKRLPPSIVRRKDQVIHRLWNKLITPGVITAVGAIIEYQPRQVDKKEILLVQTHKWGGRYSVVGERVRQHERIDEALVRGIFEETGLRGEIGEHLCTFDQIPDSGYYIPGLHQIFVDKVVTVSSKRVRLDEEAQAYVWIPAHEALTSLPLEPNARQTIEIYARHQTNP